MEETIFVTVAVKKDLLLSKTAQLLVKYATNKYDQQTKPTNRPPTTRHSQSTDKIDTLRLPSLGHTFI